MASLFVGPIGGAENGAAGAPPSGIFASTTHCKKWKRLLVGNGGLEGLLVPLSTHRDTHGLVIGLRLAFSTHRDTYEFVTGL